MIRYTQIYKHNKKTEDFFFSLKASVFFNHFVKA